MGRQKLLERDQLLAELVDRVTAAARGSGRLVFVGGEAGVGKTSLVREFTGGLAGSGVLLAGACDPMAVPRPLGPVLDFAAALGDEFAALAESGAQREKLFALFLERLRAAKRPHVVVLEDLHWADDATLDLLLFLGRRVAGCSALLLGTYRDDEVGPKHPLRRVLGDLAGVGSVQRLQVTPLSAEAVASLCAGSDVDPAELHRRTGGNPFFVTEVLAAGGAGVPVKVGDAVLARASSLGAGARAALELAAALGPVQELALLERLAPSVEAVEECLSCGMLIGSGQTSSFRHELAREAVLGAMTASGRRRAHAAVLAALEAEVPGSPDPGDDSGQDSSQQPEVLAVLAHHAAEAGDEERVLRYAPAAARLALRLMAFREARAQFARALPYAAKLGTVEHAELLDAYARACASTSHGEETDDARRRALALWREHGDLVSIALAVMRYSGSQYDLGRREAAERLSLEAIELISALPEGPAHASIYLHQAFLRMLNRDTERALEWGRRTVASGKRTGNWPAVASGYNALVGVLTTSERVEDARRYHRLCLELLEKVHGIGSPAAIANAKVMIGSGLGEVYRFREAEKHLSEARDLSAQHDLDSTHHYAAAWRALTHLYLGRWQECGEAAHWVLSRPNASLIARIMAGVALGRLRYRRGDPEAQQVLDRALEEASETDTLQRLAPVRAARSEAALAAGDARRAASEASAALPLALRHRHRWFVGELVYLMWRSGAKAELPAWVDGPFALQVRGRPLEAARAWRRMGCPFEEARALTEVGDPESLARALELLTGLGAKPAAIKVAERLRQLGVKGVPRGPRSSTAANPAGLTSRERQVLRLMAEGLRNAEIAERNRVSPRTVENQVSSVLGKLGAATRTAAVAEAQRLGLLQAAERG